MTDGNLNDELRVYDLQEILLENFFALFTTDNQLHSFEEIVIAIFSMTLCTVKPALAARCPYGCLWEFDYVIGMFKGPGTRRKEAAAIIGLG